MRRLSAFIRGPLALALAASMLFVHASAFASDESDDDFSSDVDMQETIEAELRSNAIPDSSEEYSEIHAMRVLERTLIPGSDVDLPSQSNDNSAALVPPGDPLELSHASVLDMLLDQNTEAQTQGLQQNATRVMAQAMMQVQKILDASDSGNGLLKPFGIDCFDEPAVREYLALYSGTGSKGFKVWLKRAEKWRAIVESVMREEGVPGDLLYLAMIESGFKTRVKSPKAAGGMWQFMPATAVEQGLRIDTWVDERFDPIKAAHAAARYLKKQYNRFNSWPLAMAAYNGGPGLVNSAIDKYNSNDFFKLVSYGAMYDETRRYAPKILAAAIIGKNPAAFGFDGLELEQPLKFDAIDVPPATRLERIAEACGSSLTTIEELNPELLRNQTPPDETWTVRIPQGSAQKFVEKFDALSTKYKQTETLEIKFGQSLEQIAEQTGVPARVIRALNHIAPREPAPYGASILVPAGTNAKLADFNRKFAQAFNDENAKNKPEKILALIPPKEFSLPGKIRVFYRTNRPDRIDDIANAFGVTSTQLALWNDIDPYAKLRANMMLQIYVSPNADLSRVISYPEAACNIVVIGSDTHRALIDSKSKNTQAQAKAAASKTAASNTKSASKVVYHTVVKGDSLSKIASKYGVTVEMLIKWNKLKDASSIRKGQKLIVKK